ncbi:MYCB2-like protein [Mya arenaria]|uniref:RCR-type E3 ubiquitin transferase n=1 Tax=Mya arenaria TaxID=6604 RepID=A0ABY7DQB2_MYAAR|nr:MYCB2-like protein [Mya arenaria]
MASTSVLPATRSELELFLHGNKLGQKFHELFQVSEDPVVPKKKTEKKAKKAKHKGKDKKSKRDQSPEELPETPITNLELHANPSTFNVYALVRQALLEKCMKEATKVYQKTTLSLSDSETEEEGEDKSKDAGIRIPKIVGLGLCGVFELVRETRENYPELCVKAMRALLDMLQGQQPESMKYEPANVVDGLFQLLMEIATNSGPDFVHEGQSLTSLACSALLSLVIALGDTGKLLTAVPGILTSLQKSVQAVLQGRTQLPDWFTHGVKDKALLFSFKMEDIPPVSSPESQGIAAVTSDGRFLYIHNKQGLFRIGSGYGGSLKDILLCRIDNSSQLCTINTDTLDDSFVVRMFDPHKSPMEVVSELPLKLTRKCVDAFGLDNSEVGVLYTGKSTALGIKQGGPAAGKWAELPVTKSPKIVQVAVGHEGQHALLVSEDGSVFFAGTPRPKVRRQPKAVKPKKMIRLESRNVVYAACNNGSSHVTDLKEQVVSQICLGKAHAVALTSKGRIYTFGINNKGQCGRDFNPAAAKDKGSQNWKLDQCMVCFVCGECTGYGLGCVNSGRRKDRNPGMPCGCGAGEAGCTECGACRQCAGEQLDGEEADGEILGKAKDAPFDLAKDLVHLNLIMGGNRDAKKGPLVDLFAKMERSRAQQQRNNVKLQHKFRKEEVEGDNDQGNKIVSLPPQDIAVGPGDVPVTQIACGMHHTAVLLQNGEVYTFGSNQYGQLGLGDTITRGTPTRVPLPSTAQQVVTGSHHTVILLANGQVLTCGNYQKGALGRMNAEDGAKSKMNNWYAVPGPVPGVGARFGRRATWVGASGDQTYMRIDESLINAHILSSSKVFANKTTIGLIPMGEDNAGIMKCLMINKTDGNCKSEIFKPELTVPTCWTTEATRSHCALHVLGCLDTLMLARQNGLTVVEEQREKAAAAKVYNKDDFSVTMAEAGATLATPLRRYASCVIQTYCLVDLGSSLFELGQDGGENEGDGEMLGETEEIAFECAAREKYPMLFDEPLLIQANSWYVALAKISGPSSDCGSNGQYTVTTEDQVVFKFKGSKKSNNGTDVNAGQIPQMLYRLPSRDNTTVTRKSETTESAHALSQEFSCSVSSESFEAILKLLDWAWNTFHSIASDLDTSRGPSHLGAVTDLQKLVYISRACLRLLKMFITEIYPDGTLIKRLMSETHRLAECVGSAQDLLRRILAEEFSTGKFKVFVQEPPGQQISAMYVNDILSECHLTFRQCFHAFYPTGSLKWLCLCDLLQHLEPSMSNAGGYGRLLAAIMEAMCHPTIKLTGIMPINCEPQTEEILRKQSTVMMDDNTNSAARLADIHRFPLLVDHMTMRIGMSHLGHSHISFKEVLDRLLMIVSYPVRQQLLEDTAIYPAVLIANTCSLLATIISELAATATGLETDATSNTRPLLVTPNRFTRTSQTAYWNTGNGSPDAIELMVDKPGIVIAGICLYGGDGAYNYELELLDEQSSGAQNDPNHAQRWHSIEIVKGTYGPEDCVNDIAEIKFEKPIPIRECTKYALRLRNHGQQRTFNGDGGISKVKCPDGTTFTFTACSLSNNGTNHMRGQIPQILYYSAPQEGEHHHQSSKNLAELQARKNAIDIVSAICRTATDLLHRAGSVNPAMVKETLANAQLFKSLLPLCIAYIGPVASQDPRGAVQVISLVQEVLPALSGLVNHVFPAPPKPETGDTSNGMTGAQHYAILESDHPYKPATVANYKVTFPESVLWMVLEFDPQCGTAQSEDTLQLFVPGYQKGDSGEGVGPIITGDDQDTPKTAYWPILRKFHGTRDWPKHSVIIPDYVKDEKACFFGFKCFLVGYEWKNNMDDVFGMHSGLLGKGFALSRPPTIMQALEGNLPFCWQSNERSFLKDFITCTTGTSGCRLARWLQPDSYVDPRQCCLQCCEEELKYEGSLAFGGHPPPSLETIYEVTVKDRKDAFHSICMMKDYENYSFEELRWAAPAVPRPSENMLVRSGEDGTYCANWTPSSIGFYNILVSIDGFETGEVYKVEVKEPPQGVTPPSQTLKRQQQKQMRKFIAKNSAGLRVRTNPSLQSEQIGIYNQHLGKTLLVPLDEPKSTFDEILSETVKKFQMYNQKPVVTQTTQGGPGMYEVVKCGSFGHNIRSRPNLKASPVGRITMGNQVTATEEVVNSDGTWVRLDSDSVEQFCQNKDGEAWALARSRDNTPYLVHESQLGVTQQASTKDPFAFNALPTQVQQGFDFGSPVGQRYPVFGQDQAQMFGGRRAAAYPFTTQTSVGGFGSPGMPIPGFGVLPSFRQYQDSETGRPPFGPRSGTQLVTTRAPSPGSPKFSRKEMQASGLPPDINVSSMKDLVKVLGSPRSGSPIARSGSPKQSFSPSRMNSVVSGGSDSSQFVTPPSSPLTTRKVSPPPRPSVSDPGARQGSRDELDGDLGLGPNQRKEGSVSPRFSSPGRRSPQGSPGRSGSPHLHSSPSRAQAGSPSVSQGADGVKVAFNIGASNKEDAGRLSPKNIRKDRGRTLRSKRDRANSPSQRDLTPIARARAFSASMVMDRPKHHTQKAMSPSVAEALRAVFAAFLWHEGIVHDAMACASFLKFNQNLTKEMSSFSKSSKKTEKTRQRHATDSSKDQSKKKENINEPRVRFKLESKMKGDEKPETHFSDSEKKKDQIRMKSDAKTLEHYVLPEKPSVSEKEPQLPPTLQHLVYFWDELSLATQKVIIQELVYPSPAIAVKSKKPEKKDEKKDKEKRSKKKKEAKHVGRGGDFLFGQALYGPVADRESNCELCNGMFPHPVTYHMRHAHPGCGRHAGGKGYNSGGNFCDGWAGNCGEGGVGGSSWYLICDLCREKYLKEKRQAQKEKDKVKKMKKKGGISRQQNIMLPVEAHIVLKNNAMFLLDLASASGFQLPTQSLKKQSPTRNELLLPIVTEEYRMDLNMFPQVPFQFLIRQSAQSSDSAFADDFFIDNEDRVLVRSGSLSIHKPVSYRPRLPTEPLHSPLARSGSLGKDARPLSTCLPATSHLDGHSESDASLMMNPRSAGTSPDSDPEGSKKGPFQRSVSEIVSDDDSSNSQNKGTLGRLFGSRRRNNSGGVGDGGTLLKHPSAAMQKLINSVKEDRGIPMNPQERALTRPAMNWLLRTVTNATCIHDLLWFFVSALARQDDDEDEAPEEGKDGQKNDPPAVPPPAPKEKKDPKKEQEEVPVCEHPMSDITIAGKAVEPLPESFHTLLQSIADVTMSLPLGSVIQQMALRCFCMKFHQSDHQFLYESHVFSNISQILSKSDELAEEAKNGVVEKCSYKVITLKDLTPTAEIKASSRQAMIASLTDNSTETFWESGDEDRNKVKTITITCQGQANPRIIYIHVDNTRDLGSKVSSVTFHAGPAAEDLKKMMQVEVDTRHIGWLNCPIAEEECRVLQVSMRGPDHSLRVRQVKVLGDNLELQPRRSMAQIQQANCEAETLRVFRLLTSQVFGRLIDRLDKKSPDTLDLHLDSDPDLKEHMVCSHIVQGIKKETIRVRDEWEMALLLKQDLQESRSNDMFCFELVSMVMALTGSGVGRAYLAQQSGLLKDLFSLLHTASPRVQRQVVSVLRRVLPDVKPQALANILVVPSLPPVEYSIVSLASREDGDRSFDPTRPCILDVFLACIAKALTVQSKVKAAGPHKGVTSITLAECLTDASGIEASSPRWWLRGSMSANLANSMIALIQDMAVGTLSELWNSVTKAAIAEAILSLTKLQEGLRTPQACIKTPTMWLALASLCVLNQDHVERLTSGEWVSGPGGTHGQPRPTCDNHDDGETPAIILCTECGNLCADCDRFLHLHRNKRSHQRQVFKEEEEAIKVDLHEGCGRTKLFWIMALADSKTLKAMVNAENACSKTLSCGHLCGGIRDENPCLPCLHQCRVDDREHLKQDADDMCMICFTEALSAAPAIQLKCGHVFHLPCAKEVLQNSWVGPRITFGFSLCPICKCNIDHPVLRSILRPIQNLYEDVRRKALMRLEYEGLHKAEAITTPGARFYKDPAGFAMDRYAYYVCYKCKKAYYGGEARCDEQAGVGDVYDPQELVCGACSDVTMAQMCPKHGTDFLEYKCRYCCSVAVFFCFGTTHFCNLCHDNFQQVTSIPKPDLPKCPCGPRGKQLEGDECPLHLKHPPTGEEFALGCGVCRNAHTF